MHSGVLSCEPLQDLASPCHFDRYGEKSQRHLRELQVLTAALMNSSCTGAGLGGGSANAATALWAANQLADCPATNEELLEWSGAIGSDISVFFSQGAAYCTGRCEAPVCVGCLFI